MELDDLSISVFCLLEEIASIAADGQRLRQRGPQPALHDSEVLTMEVDRVYLAGATIRTCWATFSGTGHISSWH